MISEAKVVFNEHLKNLLEAKWPAIYKVVNEHPIKEKAIEGACHELIRMGNRFDLRYNQRYDIIIQSAANMYIKRLISDLEEKAKSPAEMSRILKEEKKEKMYQDLADGKLVLTDDLLEELK